MENKTHQIKEFICELFILMGVMLARLITIPISIIFLIIINIIYKITKLEKLEDFMDKLFMWIFSPPLIMPASIAFWAVTIINFFIPIN